ncbi:TPA: hypothetical protein ACX6S4_003606 [Photobacterium damselae]
MKNFLKTKSVDVDGEQIVITQLSGLERYDFLDYCTDLPKPIQPIKPSEDASQAEQDVYINEMEKCLKQWGRVNFIGQSRLVAYGYKEAGETLEDRHEMIMSSMTPDQVQLLHNEIAKFSGIPLPDPVEDNAEPGTAETEESLDPTDPKD